MNSQIITIIFWFRMVINLAQSEKVTKVCTRKWTRLAGTASGVALFCIAIGQSSRRVQPAVDQVAMIGQFRFPEATKLLSSGCLSGVSLEEFPTGLEEVLISECVSQRIEHKSALVIADDKTAGVHRRDGGQWWRVCRKRIRLFAVVV